MKKVGGYVRVHRLAVGLAAAAIVALSGCTTDSKVTSAASEFVGSEKCATCHAAEFKTWKDTYHSKMVRTPQDGLLKDALDNWAKDAKGNAGPTKGNITARRPSSTTWSTWSARSGSSASS